jgi:hypothetical protein
MGRTDAGRAEGAEVENQVFLPFAQIHNDSKGFGKAGGLFIQQTTLDEFIPDTVINTDVFKPLTLQFEKRGEIEDAPGVVSPNFHIAVIAFDHTDKGYARTWKDYKRLNDAGEPVATFTVVCAIKEALSQTAPFKINFRGPNAYRMANLIGAFSKFVVGRISAEKKKKLGKDAKPASRNQFWLPVSMAGEKLGSGNKASWGCPIQDLIGAQWVLKDKVNKDGKVTGQYRDREGVPTLEKYDKDPNSIYELFIAKDAEGVALVELFAGWVGEYADAVKTITQNGVTGNGTGAAAGADFLGEGAGLPISEGQQGFIGDLDRDIGPDNTADQQLQFLRETGVLIGGTDGVTIMNLTIQGASKLIDHLKPLAAAAKAAKKQAAGAAPELEDDMLPGGDIEAPSVDDVDAVDDSAIE